MILISTNNLCSGAYAKFIFWIGWFASLEFNGPVNSRSCWASQFTELHFPWAGLVLLAVLVHILFPETDSCLSWISGRERMTVGNISWSISMKECCRTLWKSNPQHPDHQSDTYPTEPLRLVDKPVCDLHCLLYLLYYISIVLEDFFIVPNKNNFGQLLAIFVQKTHFG